MIPWLWTPESPRWLLARGRRAQATALLRCRAGPRDSSLHPSPRRAARTNGRLLTVDTMKGGERGEGVEGEGFRKEQGGTTATSLGMRHLFHRPQVGKNPSGSRIHSVPPSSLTNHRRRRDSVPPWFPEAFAIPPLVHFCCQIWTTVSLLLLWPITALGYYGLALSMSALGQPPALLPT